ncbi:hypothetical protein LJR225_004314 [Phenylobacterium sp. LjRoot225]|uniref:hypothetical protein n=1 Tax=Phenylobacterium sp. LjRoot225 TaxID=3342285 RepID=UPI003ECEFF2E
MISLALAASLFLADQPAAQQAVAAAPPAAEAAQAPAAEAPAPTGAPTDDYQFVAWCYGVLSGYLDLHDQVMPEVTRIETTWRRPGSKLSDDLKVYEDQQRQGRADLKRFQNALTAAEKASLQPINVTGSAAMKRGHAVWNVGPDVTKARLAQEWMSWSLPSRCPVVADTLAKRASLLGASLKGNAAPDSPTSASEATPAEPAAPAPEPAPSGKN